MSLLNDMRKMQLDCSDGGRITRKVVLGSEAFLAYCKLFVDNQTGPRSNGILGPLRFRGVAVLFDPHAAPTEIQCHYGEDSWQESAS